MESCLSQVERKLGSREGSLSNSCRAEVRPEVGQETLYQVQLNMQSGGEIAEGCRGQILTDPRFGAETLQDVSVILSAPEALGAAGDW